MAAIAQQVVGTGVAAVGDVMKEVGQAIHPGQVRPEQMDMTSARMGLTVEDTAFFKAKDGTSEVFVVDQLEMSKLFKTICCPVCCTFIPFSSDKRKMEFEKLCSCCSCKWAVNIDGKRAGAMTDVGCCDNGCMFCMCPCFTCDGYAKVMGMQNDKNEEKFVFLSKLSTCWPIVMTCGVLCSGFGLLYAMMEGCYNYSEGKSMKVISQPVYKGPWNRKDGGEPNKIGTFFITQRFTPCCLIPCCIECPCCAFASPFRFYYKAEKPEGYDLALEEQTLLGMTLQLYRGMPTPCKVFSSAGFRTPTGIPCLDIGLETESKWMSPQEVMQDSKQ